VDAQNLHISENGSHLVYRNGQLRPAISVRLTAQKLTPA